MVHSIFSSLSTIGVSGCGCILVFPKANWFTCWYGFVQTRQVSLGLSCKRIHSHSSVQNSTFNTDVSICKVSIFKWQTSFVVHFYAATSRLFSLRSIEWSAEVMPDRSVQLAVWNHAYAAFGFWKSSFDFWITMRTPWLVSTEIPFWVLNSMRFLYANESVIKYRF